MPLLASGSSEIASGLVGPATKKQSLRRMRGHGRRRVIQNPVGQGDAAGSVQLTSLEDERSC
jgi:hypothetical protein